MIGEERWAIHTYTGSVYYVSRDSEGQWWMGADNVPNPTSCYLGDGTWVIQQPAPWPPVVGESIMLLPPPELEFGDPRRVPGGGKYTSPVVSFERLGGG